jgi:hypothetical protein
MLITSFGPRLVQQVAIDIEAVLTRWIDRLRSSRYLAFGDDPRPVYEIEDDLTQVIERFDRLRLQFEYGNAESEAIAVYRAVRERLYMAVEFVEKVRLQDRGSTEHTRKLLHFLTSGREQLRRLAELELGAYGAGAKAMQLH